MVSDAHVDLLATAFVRLVDPAADPQAVGLQMLRHNARSIRARYSHNAGFCDEADAQADAYRYQPWRADISPAMLSKQIACLNYQSCEFDGWEQCESRHMLDQLQAHCPKYDDLSRDAETGIPWGVDDHPEPDTTVALLVIFRRPQQTDLPL
jgi:hypothetical protein